MIKLSVSPKLNRLERAFVNSRVNGLQELKDTIQDMAFNIERYGKQLTPVDTGRLRGSIGVKMFAGGVRAEIGTDVHYAKYVHWGTSKMRGRPFLTEGKRLTLKKITGDDIADRLDKVFRIEFTKL